MSQFWSTSTLEPKRQFRWVLEWGSAPKWMIKSVDKPVATVSSQAHKFYGHTYNFPGVVTWNDINITLVDPVSPDAVSTLARILYQAGYKPPFNENEALISISKDNAGKALGAIQISQQDAVGTKIETWTLTNPIFTNVDFGGNLSYENEALIELKMTIKYDWAQLVKAGVGNTAPTQTVNGRTRQNTYWVQGTN